MRSTSLGQWVFHLVIIVVFAFSCQEVPQKAKEEETKTTSKSSGIFVDDQLDKYYATSVFRADLKDILARDTLKVITINSSTSYFLYKGEPMGYEYELSSLLAESMGVNLKIVVAEDIDEIFDMLINGDGDLIAYNLTITSSRKEFVDFTLPLNFTHQVLVQKKPDGWRKMKLHEIENQLVRNPIELIDLPVYIRENSSYRERLENLSDELGESININYLPGNLSTDEILNMVDDGGIPYTISDYNIAKINATYLTNLDIETTIGVMQQLAWAVRKTSPELKKTINEWIKSHRRSAEFNNLYNKYFKNPRAFKTRAKSEYYTLESNKISEYDNLIKETAKKLGWDWRFLASQVYQESKFDPKETSWVGAIGLMQLMPKTAKSYGYSKLTRPKSNLAAGAAHIRYLNNYWKKHIADSTERLHFVLASYNAGQNHVQDARRLAEKYGKNPNVWIDEVETTMRWKSQKKYFNDPVVYYGYCRGEEPVNYVTEIKERYENYVEFVKK
jgi:membrane-bound lytic murein transglycosylase F